MVFTRASPRMSCSSGERPSVFVLILAEENAFIPNRKADADTTKTKNNIITTGDMDMRSFIFGVSFIFSSISLLLIRINRMRSAMVHSTPRHRQAGGAQRGGAHVFFYVF